MKGWLISVAAGLLAVGLFLTMAGVVVADGETPLLVEYPVPGNPQHVVVQSPGRVWFTLPDQNAVGLLVVTSTTEYQVITYTTTVTEPYAIDYASGAVWFTGRAANKIGRLDPTTGLIAEFPITTTEGVTLGVAGLDAVAGSPVRVWFTEAEGNALGQLVVTDTTTYQVYEYPLPTAWGDGQPQDIFFKAQNNIWFTAPGANAIGNFISSTGNFVQRNAGTGSQPWSIVMDSGGYPWFTEIAGSQIGKFFPQTIAIFDWYALPHTSSEPYDIAVGQGYIWFTERAGNRVGQLSPSTRAIYEFSLPEAGPLGLAIDTNGVVWIAEGSQSAIAVWQPPYFRAVYLPLVIKAQE